MAGQNRTVSTGIVRRGNSYRFTVALGMDVNGKQIRKYSTYTPPEGVSEKRADKLAIEEYQLFKNRCKGLAAFNENMRFKDLCEEYFRVYAPNKLKPITAYDYEKTVYYRFIPYFGNKKLMMNPQAPTGYLKRFGKTYNLPGIHPHALRHTMATLSIANGADIISVSEKLGHAEPSITLNVYSHANEEAQRRSNEALANALYRVAK